MGSAEQASFQNHQQRPLQCSASAGNPSSLQRKALRCSEPAGSLITTRKSRDAAFRENRPVPQNTRFKTVKDHLEIGQKAALLGHKQHHIGRTRARTQLPVHVQSTYPQLMCKLIAVINTLSNYNSRTLSHLQCRRSLQGTNYSARDTARDLRHRFAEQEIPWLGRQSAQGFVNADVFPLAKLRLASARAALARALRGP
jgi:hypothetical protein